MKNADLILKAGLLATCLPVIGCNSNKKTEKEAEERPNILFILSDDHTGQAWGIYGGILADYVRMRISAVWPRKVACWITAFVRIRSLHLAVRLS